MDVGAVTTELAHLLHDVDAAFDHRRRRVCAGGLNTGQTPPYSNYLYRSADDGATWSVVNTTSTHRHIHGVRYHAASGKLYVFFGDSDGDGIWVSSDNGATLQPLCTAYACITIDAAFDPAGAFMLFGQDNYTSQNRIVKVALSTGVLTPIADIPYDSFSSIRLDATTYSVRTTHEGGVTDRRSRPSPLRVHRRRCHLRERLPDPDPELERTLRPAGAVRVPERRLPDPDRRTRNHRRPPRRRLADAACEQWVADGVGGGAGGADAGGVGGLVVGDCSDLVCAAVAAL